MIGQVEISHYDEEATTMSPSNARYTVVLTEAWPERISAYAMGYDNGDFGNFEISIRYKQWHEKGTRKQQPGFGGNLATDQQLTTGFQ